MEDVELQALLQRNVTPEAREWREDTAGGTGPELTTIQIEFEDSEAGTNDINTLRTEPAGEVEMDASPVSSGPLFSCNEDVQWILNSMESHKYCYETKTEFQEFKLRLDNGDTAAIRTFLTFFNWHWRHHLKSDSTTESALQSRSKAIHYIMELLSKAHNKTEVLDGFDCNVTLLYNAIKMADFEMVKALVRAGANVNQLTTDGQTALHAAASSEHTILEYFLDFGTIENTTDGNGLGAIHFAATSRSLESVKLLLIKFGTEQLTWQTKFGRTVWHEIALNGANDAARYLIQNEHIDHLLGLNVVDFVGRTPLVYAINENLENMSALLLRHGAALSVDGEKISAVNLITKKFVNPSRFLEDLFDDCIYKMGKNLSFVYVDYQVFVNSKDKGKSQVDVLEELVRCNQSKILKHPLIESLIYVKWKCSISVFYIMLATYAAYLISLNTFVIATFNKIDSYNGTCGNHSNATSYAVTTRGACVEGCEWQYWLLSAFIYVSVGTLLVQECIWLSLQGSLFYPSLKSLKKIRPRSCLALRFEPCTKWFGLGLALALPLAISCAGAPAPWQRHLACAALLLAWLQAMLLLSRFPTWGYYVLMLERVAINISKIFLTVICLVVGFSICFIVQYHSKPPFDGPFAAFVKTMAMMLSEFDYEGLFDENHADELKDSKAVVRFLFVIFVIFIAIVLMNFMIGVAVSDVSELAALSDIRRLEKQLELLRTVEGLGSTMFGKRCKKLSTIRYYRTISKPLESSDPSTPTTCCAGRTWDVEYTTQRHDWFKLSIPSDLQNSLLKSASKTKEVVYYYHALYTKIIDEQDTANNYNEKDDLNSTLKTLNDRTSSMEAGIQDLIDNFKKINDRIQCIEDVSKDMKESINKLKEDVKSLSVFERSGRNVARRLQEPVKRCDDNSGPLKVLSPYRVVTKRKSI